jgi:hypothetical protein
MSRFLATNKNRPCPICAKTNGNCRVSQESDQVLCRTFPDGDRHPDYRYVKPTSDGGWGIFYPATDNDFDAAAWSQRKAEREQRDLEIERQRLEKCLSPDRRDTEIRAVLSQLTLTDGDRRYLENRGVPTEVIGRCRSVTQWHKIASPVHVNLPGVSKYGDRLNNPWDGILIAFPDHLGRLVAMRLHDPNAAANGNPKYIWLSSKGRGVTPHLPNGEMPIGLFWPNGQPTDKPKRIGLSEGPEFKAPAAANRLSYPVIGFSGYQFSQSPELLWDTIAAVNPDAEIVVIPDGGAVANTAIANNHRETLTNLESANQPASVAWWSQLTKADGDIDEIQLNGDRQINHITPDQFLSYCPKTKVEKFTDWVKKQSKRIKPPGFGAPKIAGNRFDGDRQSAWQAAINRGERFLDNSLMGSGKSHSVPNVTNPYGGVTWYLYSDHRNPTVEAIARDFVDLYPRNSKGFYRDSNGKIKPADADHPATITKGHCVRSELFPLLSELGHNPNDGGGSNPICQSCPMANVCCHAEGWYRADRRVALRSNRIRCHIDSMPRDGWDYSNDIILVDEPSQLIKPTQKIESSYADLLIEADKIRPTLSNELWLELDAYLQAIKPLFDAKGYGLNNPEIVEKLPAVSPELSTAITAYHHDLSQLFPAVEQETLAENLTHAERKKWAAGLKAFNHSQRLEQQAKTQDNLANLPPNALAHLITGNAATRIQGQTLTLTLDRRQDYAFLNRAAAVGFLDATINGDRLQSISGLERTIEVIHNTPDKPLGNLTVKQIKVQGIGSKSLSNTALNRLHAILKTFPDMPIIGLKSWANRLDLDGYWWRDSRGTNDYAGIPELLAIGLPNPNLGAIQDDYLAINGNLDGFEEHYARLVSEEILQLIGRQRANRYGDRQFVLNLVTPENCDLSWLTDYGITLEIKQGFEVNPAAGNQNQITRHAIVSAILDGHHTQTAIAAAIGKTQQAISKQLTAAGITLEKLIDKLSKFLPEMATTNPYKAYKRDGCITPELLGYLDWFFGLDLPAIAVEAISVIESEGWLGFLKYLEQYPKPIQGKFFGVLYSLMGTNPLPTLVT